MALPLAAPAVLHALSLPVISRARRRARPLRRMRVLQVLPELGYGGLERVVITLCRTLDPAEFECEVLCINGRGPFADEVEALGVPVHVIGSRSPDYLSALKVYRRLRERRPDVVHTHNTQAFFEGGIAAFLARVPTHVHTDHAREYPERLRYVVAEHLASRLAYRVVGCSVHTSEALARHIGISRRKLITIPNGIVDPPPPSIIERRQLRAELGASEHSFLIGSISRLSRQKGIPYLLEATRRLIQRIPNLHVAVVGDGPERAALEAQARELGIDSAVSFTGARPDGPRLMHALDLFVIPSLWEGLPLTALEAMAAGRAICATDVGGTGTAVQDGVSGVLVPPQDVDALVHGLERLASDETLRQRLGDAGRQLYERHFSATVMAEAYADVYRRLGESIAR